MPSWKTSSSDGNDEMHQNGHLFFYMADEDGSALNVTTDGLDMHKSSLLASGSRKDVGDWQLHLQSKVI